MNGYDDGKNIEQLRAEVARIKAAIREHKDQLSDSRCWLDDSKLYSALDDRGYDSSLPAKCEFLESCSRFWEQRQTPEAKDRRAGEMTIAQLQAEVERLRERAERAEADLKRLQEHSGWLLEQYRRAAGMDAVPAGESAPKSGKTIRPPWSVWLEFNPNVSERSPVVKGTRVTVSHVLSLSIDGWTWVDIIRSHPELTTDDIRACMAYATAECGEEPAGELEEEGGDPC